MGVEERLGSVVAEYELGFFTRLIRLLTDPVEAFGDPGLMPGQDLGMLGVEGAAEMVDFWGQVSC